MSVSATAEMRIDREHALQLLRGMIRIRRFEERCVELYSASAIRGFLHLYIGEEAVAVGVMQALTATTPSWRPIASMAKPWPAAFLPTP